MDAPLKRFLFYSHIVATLAILVAGPVEYMGTVGICLNQKGLDHKMASDINFDSLNLIFQYSKMQKLFH